MIAKKLTLWGIAGVFALLVLIAVGTGISAALKAYSRAEQRADAENRVRLAHIAIRRGGLVRSAPGSPQIAGPQAVV